MRVPRWPQRCDPVKGDAGATAAEYALIGALIAVVIVGAVTLLGANLSSMWSDSASQIGSAVAVP